MPRQPRRRVAPAGGNAPAATGAESSRRVRENLPRPTTQPSSLSPSPAQPARKRRGGPFGFFSKLTPRFAQDVIAELRKVTWPTLAETRYLTIVVAVVALAVGAFLGGVDLLFGWIIERLFF